MTVNRLIAHYPLLGLLDISPVLNSYVKSLDRADTEMLQLRVRSTFIALMMIVVSVVVIASGQKSSKRPQDTLTPQETDFLISPTRPFVYIEFIKTGPRRAWGDGEPDTGVYLRLVNNCPLRIQIRADSGDGGPHVVHDVVYDQYVGAVVWYRDGKREPPEQVPRSKMPYGYYSEFAGWLVVEPGKEVVFSVPINHISNDWHIEVPFEFLLPEQHFAGTQPTMKVRFAMWQVPDKARSAFQEASR